MRMIDMVMVERLFENILHICFEISYLFLGFAGDDHSYVKNPIWWLGMTTSKFIDYRCKIG